MAGLAFSFCMSKPLLVHCEQHLNHHLPLIVPINTHKSLNRKEITDDKWDFIYCEIKVFIMLLALASLVARSQNRPLHYRRNESFQGARTQSVHHGCFYIFPRPIQNEVHTNTNIQPFRSLLKVKINCGNLPYFVFKVLLVTYAGNYLKVQHIQYMLAHGLSCIVW